MALAATHFVCDTEFSADSVEFCPLPLHARFMAVGTYQLLPPAEPASADTKLNKGDDDDDDDGQQDAAPVKTNRTGRLYLFEVAQEGDGSDTSVTVNQVFRQETSAILDIKWSHQALNGDAVAAIVTSTGETEVWALEPETAC
ncbi:hypothetical protein BC831DRAFT_516230 [Entophlyctis helioformis]|nr:hypothetical protein BC831DRAFT_516230 [Entophlyctis helioformis]